jgi:hypothetical protein
VVVDGYGGSDERCWSEWGMEAEGGLGGSWCRAQEAGTLSIVSEAVICLFVTTKKDIFQCLLVCMRARSEFGYEEQSRRRANKAARHLASYPLPQPAPFLLPLSSPSSPPTSADRWRLSAVSFRRGRPSSLAVLRRHFTRSTLHPTLRHYGELSL